MKLRDRPVCGVEVVKFQKTETHRSRGQSCRGHLASSGILPEDVVASSHYAAAKKRGLKAPKQNKTKPVDPIIFF